MFLSQFLMLFEKLLHHISELFHFVLKNLYEINHYLQRIFQENLLNIFSNLLRPTLWAESLAIPLLFEILSIPFWLKSIRYGVLASLSAQAIKFCDLQLITFILSIHILNFIYQHDTVSLG